MAVNSRQKGKRFELELAHLLQGYGYDARRGVQYSGLNGDADVVGLPGIHIEAKFRESLNLYDAMEQSIRDARDGETPVVIHKKSRKPILVTMLFEDWMALYKKGESNDTEGKDS